MFTISAEAEQRIPLKIWVGNRDHLEDRALHQAVNLTKLPFVCFHVASMSYVHSGFGVPIRTVLATEQAVIPNAVGFDIACGIRIVRTTLTVGDLHGDHLKSVLDRIRNVLPETLNHSSVVLKGRLRQILPESGEVMAYWAAPPRVRGTFDSGNHCRKIRKTTSGS